MKLNNNTQKGKSSANVKSKPKMENKGPKIKNQPVQVVKSNFRPQGRGR